MNRLCVYNYITSIVYAINFNGKHNDGFALPSLHPGSVVIVSKGSFYNDEVLLSYSLVFSWKLAPGHEKENDADDTSVLPGIKAPPPVTKTMSLLNISVPYVDIGDSYQNEGQGV